MRTTLLTAIALAAFATAAFATGSFSPGSSSSYGYSSEGFFEGESYLGVDTRDITPARMGPLHLKEEAGVEVTMVDQDAPAGKAGIKEHDVIMSINGQQVESVEQLRRLIHEIPVGRVVTIGILREGQPLTLKAQLADRNKLFHIQSDAKEFHFEMPALPAMPDMDVPISVVIVHSSLRSGLMVENLTPQLGDFFGAKNGQGVLVRSVEKGSRAEKAGFRAGDVIVRVNGDTISDSGDFSHAMRSRKDNTISVGIIRDKKEQTLTMTLPERSQSGVYEESFELPELSAEARLDIAKAQSALAQIRPKIELYTQEMRRVKPEVERSMRDLQRQMENVRQERRDQSSELRKQQEKLREQLRRFGRRGRADI